MHEGKHCHGLDIVMWSREDANLILGLAVCRNNERLLWQSTGKQSPQGTPCFRWSQKIFGAGEGIW